MSSTIRDISILHSTSLSVSNKPAYMIVPDIVEVKRHSTERIENEADDLPDIGKLLGEDIFQQPTCFLAV